jgi:hypothetical protein
MKITYSLFTGLLGVTCLAALTGCGTNAIFPNPGAPVVERALGSIQGSNYGGHAPIVGAHVFVLQAGTNGYGTAAKSLLSATYSSTGPAAAYPTALDISGGVTNGDYYVTTDNEGDFNISGDYTCTAGLPVYVYASGGVSAVEPSSPVTAYSFSGTTATLTGKNLLSVGQQVQFFGLQGGAAVLNVGIYTVTAATLTNFTVSGAIGVGSGTTAGTVLPYIPAINNNTAIANMAVLGVCPSTGSANFSSLRYVYLNEVSTVAAAYALSGFFSNSATSLSSTDAVHLAIPMENGAGSPAWVGIENAALNAAQLYNIEGLGNISNTGDGEGHIANLTTPSGGTVPQALIDSMANALAGCVDSGNTALNPSTACTTLFANALSGTSSAGTPTGTKPIDTATAAINFAHNPWNKNASTILALAGSVFPYAPTTSSVTDLAVAITYPIAHQSGEFGGIAIDAAGDAWVTSHDDPALTKLSPQGVQTVIKAFPSAITPGDVAFDSKGNAWVAIRDIPTPILYDGTYEFTSAGVLVSGSPFATTGGSPALALADDIQVAVDANDFVYFSNHPYDNILELDNNELDNNTGAAVNSYANNTYTNDGPFGVAFDKNNNLWMSSNITTNSVIQFQNGSTGGSNTNPLRTVTNIPNPEAFALDANGNIWVSDAQDGSTNHNDIYEISNIYGAANAITSTRIQGGGAENTVGMAVDGSGLVYAASVTGGASNTGSLAVFNNSATALTGSNGIDGQFTISGGSAQVPMNGPYFIAIDASGDVWAQTNTTVVEYIGVATPVLTPLSAAVKAGTIAVRP